MAKDMIGNEIREGDFVLVFIDAPRVICKVMKVSPGGLVVAGKETPGMVHLLSQHDTLFMPKSPGIPNMICLRDPDSDKTLADSLSRTGLSAVPNLKP